MGREVPIVSVSVTVIMNLCVLRQIQWIRLAWASEVACWCGAAVFLVVSYPQIIFVLHSFVTESYLWSLGHALANFLPALVRTCHSPGFLRGC